MTMTDAKRMMGTVDAGSDDVRVERDGPVQGTEFFSMGILNPAARALSDPSPRTGMEPRRRRGHGRAPRGPGSAVHRARAFSIARPRA